MGKELEIKLHVESPEQLRDVLHWHGFDAFRTGEDTTYRMQTVYYDTPEGFLSRLHWTLRCRRENNRSVVCLKTPAKPVAGMKVRGEWETDSDDVAAALPELVRLGAPAELLPLFAQTPPQPSCSAEFVRQASVLRLADGSICELACDEGVLRRGGREQPFCEVELELKSDESSEMQLLCAALCKAFGLRREPKSKVARAMALLQL